MSAPQTEEGRVYLRSYLAPLNDMLARPDVTDIYVNRPGELWIETIGGAVERHEAPGLDEPTLARLARQIAALSHQGISREHPLLSATLPDGARVQMIAPPATRGGMAVAIRKHVTSDLTLDDYVANGAFEGTKRRNAPEDSQVDKALAALLDDGDIAGMLSAAVRARKNILISGGTGAGKSTLLGVLAEAIPVTERIVTIEDTAELSLDQEHVVRMETRPVNIEGRGQITARDLLINALRMRPDRIIVGEVRGGEALEMLQAMNTGHDGGIGTIHANSTRDALLRLETMVLMAGTELPSRAVREQIVSAIHLLVQVRRYDDGIRRIESVAEITGLEGTTPQTQELFGFRRRGKQGRKVIGHFGATGVIPRFVDELREEGVQIPSALFQRSEETGL